jgi:hypothetical protein
MIANGCPSIFTVYALSPVIARFGIFVCRAVARVLRKWDEARTERRLNSFREG